MRYIVIFLLLVNVAYFGWQLLFAKPMAIPQRPPPRPLLNSGLTLVSEFAGQSAQLAREQAVTSRVCYLVGDFSSVDDAYGFLQSAEDRGWPSELLLGGERLPPQYRVYLPPASSREVASISLDGLSERLTQQNLEIEVYLITRGLLENAIALGVYGEEDAAERVREQVSALGYEVQIGEIPRSTGALQVVLAAPDFDPVDEAEWLDFAGVRPDLARSENLCETIAQGEQFP